jgi:phosphatidylglycerol:prolipoprotein diacylglycerol transferase
VIAAACIFARRRGLSSLHILDMAAFASTVGLCLGRVANFINAELWGKALPAHMQSYVAGASATGGDPPWWSVKYPQEVVEVWLQSQPPDPRLDLLAPLETVVSNSERFYVNVVSAAQAGNEQVIATLKPLLTAYYPSQIFQAITDGPILMGVLALLWLRPRKPGVIGSWFLIAYGVLRVVTELFRQPDEGVALTFGLLSRGQTLSALGRRLCFRTQRLVSGGVWCSMHQS